MQYPWSVAVLAIGLLVSVPGAASAQATTVEALARKVDSLERRVAELERRLAERSSASTSANARADSTAMKWLDIANWRRLREDMSYDAVRRILGEPDRVSGGTIALWMYPNGGQVGFFSGRLSSWTEPPR